MDQPDVLQICPWFLDYAMAQKHRFTSKWDRFKIGSMINSLELDQLATRIVYAPIDLFQLFEKVIIHEVRWPVCEQVRLIALRLLIGSSVQLSHTRRGGLTDDPLGYGSYGMITQDNPSYRSKFANYLLGWKNCRKMSKNRSPQDDVPDKNAGTCGSQPAVSLHDLLMTRLIILQSTLR